MSSAEAKRFREFGGFFKSYLSVSTLVVASTPIFVGLIGALPRFDALSTLMTTLSSVVCFFMVAYVFYVRHRVAPWFVPIVLGATKSFNPSPKRTFWLTALPLILLVLGLLSLSVYLNVYTESIAAARSTALSGIRDSHSPPPPATDEHTLATKTPFSQVSYYQGLIVLYVAFYAFIELAFIVMAMKEYVLAIANVSDLDMIADSAGLKIQHKDPATPSGTQP
jgi:hypothetical protein